MGRGIAKWTKLERASGRRLIAICLHHAPAHLQTTHTHTYTHTDAHTQQNPPRVTRYVGLCLPLLPGRRIRSRRVVVTRGLLVFVDPSGRRVLPIERHGTLLSCHLQRTCRAPVRQPCYSSAASGRVQCGPATKMETPGVNVVAYIFQNIDCGERGPPKTQRPKQVNQYGYGRRGRRREGKSSMTLARFALPWSTDRLAADGTDNPNQTRQNA